MRVLEREGQRLPTPMSGVCPLPGPVPQMYKVGTAFFLPSFGSLGSPRRMQLPFILRAARSGDKQEVAQLVAAPEAGLSLLRLPPLPPSYNDYHSRTVEPED